MIPASQIRTQQRLAELDAALAAVDADEAEQLAAIEEAGSQRQADAVRSANGGFTDVGYLPCCKFRQAVST